MNTLTLGKSLLCGMLMLAAFNGHAEPNLSLGQNLSQNLALDEAIKLATQNQPLLQSLDDAAAASREAAVAEGQLPDPKLRLGVQNLPITNSDALRFNRDDMTMSTVGLMQEVIPRAKREAASKKMEAEAGQYHAEQLATARSIQRDVALAWLDVYEAQRKTELYQRIADEMRNERKVTAARISSGGTQASDVLRLDSQLSMMSDKRLTAQRDERKARSQLARWIGTAANRPIAPELPTISSIAGGSQGSEEIETHPLLQSARQIEAVAETDAERAKAERMQNWSWEVMYGKRRSDLSDMVTFLVAIDLPWDRANRQDRRTAEKLMLVEKARKLTEDRRRELLAEFEAAKADWDTAQARESEHQQRLIPNAEARLMLAKAGYASGRQNLSEVWEARRGVLEVGLEHWSIIADQQRAAVRLAYLLNNNNLFPANQSLKESQQ
ncbi:MAG TPA: TolC family protein [Methylophilaceae bacterium]|nr:TolC family protein [Methylophilaceae bacterium]